MATSQNRPSASTLQSLADLTPAPISQIVSLAWVEEADRIHLRPRLRKVLVIFALCCAVVPFAMLGVLVANGTVELDILPIVLICATLITMPIVLFVVAKRMLAPLRDGDILTVDSQGELLLPISGHAIACGQIACLVTMHLNVERTGSSGNSAPLISPALAWFVVEQDGERHTPHGVATLENAYGAQAIESKFEAMAQKFAWPRTTVHLSADGDVT